MQFKKEDLFTIPNILTYIRFICLPIFLVFMGICFNCEDPAARTGWLFAGFATFLFGYVRENVYLCTPFNKSFRIMRKSFFPLFAILLATMTGCTNAPATHPTDEPFRSV